MNQQVKEGFDIFINAFNRLDGRRKELSVLGKRMQEDIEQCLKRIEEVKLNKKRIPFYSPQYECPFEEEPVKEVRRRGRPRKEEKTASENNADSKLIKSRFRKRASDDDLIEEQPVSKRRGVAESKAIQQDTPKKVLKSISMISEKKSALDIIGNVLEEKENNNSFRVDLINGNGTVLSTKTSNNQVMKGEKPLIDIDKNSKSKNPNSFENSDDSNNKSEDVVQSKTFVKDKKTDKTICDQEKTVLLPDSKNNTNLESERHITKNTEVTRIEMKSVTNVSKPAMSSTTHSSYNQLNSIVKKDETIKLYPNSNSKLLKTINVTLKNTIILSSEEDVQVEGKENLEPVDNNKQKIALKNETVSNDFIVPPIPTIHATNGTSSQLSSDEGSPVQKRFTRSKSKPVKGKEKICPSSSSELSSNEDSPVKEQSTQSKMVKGKDLPVSAPVENVAFSSDEAPVPLPRVTRSKMAKPKEQPKLNLNDCNHTPPAEEEIAPVPIIRMTRSKMAKPKKDKVDSAERSGEESDAKSEFNSCSDGEGGKRKVKDIVKMLNDKQAMVLLSPVPLTKEQEKENRHIGIMKMLDKKDKITPIMKRKAVIAKTTPLQVRNGYITPNKKPTPIISSATRNKSVMDDVEKRKKEEEARLKRLKEEEVLRKKQEMLKIKQEELKKKHEEKMVKAAAMREAAEKEKTECILKQEREREEREKMAKAEIERKKNEEAYKKKLANQTKAAEVENRRLREEAARAAKLKEMEEEQRQHEELRQKQLEENERIMKMRQEDQRAKEVSKQKLLYQKEIQKKMKANMIPLKDKDNYSITGDLLVDEDLEDMDEESSKKEIPTWAKREERWLPSKVQVHYPMSLVSDFFCCPSSSPDLTDIFGKMTMKRIRSSSAIWLDSPPLKVFQPVNN